MTKEKENFIMLPIVDFCFKELMQNSKVRQGFIAALLDIDPKEIEETILLPTFLSRENIEDKLGILDVRVLLQDRTQIDMEMQVDYFQYWTERSIFYLSKMYTEQIRKGESYEVLKKCIHVGILDFVHFTEDTRCYRTIVFCNKETGEPYSDLMEIKILELKKLSKAQAELDGIESWMKFFAGKKREEFEIVAKNNEYIEEAYETLLHLSEDDKKRMEYEAREKALRDYNSQMNSALERGKEIGEKIGETKGQELGLKALVKTLKPLLANFEEVYQAIRQNEEYADVSEEEVRKYY